MEIVSCDNSACPYWKDDHYSQIDKSAHCPIYEGQEMLNGHCSDFTSHNSVYPKLLTQLSDNTQNVV